MPGNFAALESVTSPSGLELVCGWFGNLSLKIPESLVNIFDKHIKHRIW